MKTEKLGRYELLAEIGQGAMGVVYKAIDPLIDRTVAIKTINLNLSKEELADFEERFNREAKTAGRLNHPNIVTIYDVGRSGHIAFMAMEYLEGRELKDIIASGETLPLDRAAEIIAQVADGLAFAHENGTVHRDIKPANIMVLSNGSVKITDFGIAKMSSSSRTQIGIVLGSPKYMSPEQIVGKPVDGRSDIFSLGAVLYELVTGKSAFGGEDNTLTTIMYRVLNEMPQLPGSINPSIPGAFDYIIARALAKEPDKRYQSAREMANDLRNYRNLAYTAPAASAASAPAVLNKPAIVFSGHKSNRDYEDATLVVDTRQLHIAPENEGSERKRTLAIISFAAVFLLAGILTVFLVSRHETQKNGKPQGTNAETVSSAKQNETKASEPDSAQGKLSFSILPWGEVVIDGKSQGASPPLKGIKLPSGKHEIEIRNAGFPPYRETVEVKPGASKKIRHEFK